MIIQSVTLKDMPIPPSVNAAYATNFRTKRRFKSKDYQLYEAMVIHWKNLHPLNLGRARQFTTLIGDGMALQVDITFYFPRSKILTKAAGKAPSVPKHNDTSNRIKIAHDVLADLLSIDDCLFWDGSFKKKVLNSDHPGFMDVTFTLIEIEGY